jgi:hypothetical protein
MKLLMAIWQDVRRGENIDLYVVVAAAFLLAVANIFGAVPQSWLGSVTLAVLGVLAISALRLEHKLPDYSKTRHTKLYDGRITIDESVNFYATARSEVVLVGTALSTFRNEVVERNPREVKEQIQRMLGSKVNFELLILDPDSPIAAAQARTDTDLIGNIRDSLKKFDELGKTEFAGYPGKFEVHLYNTQPYCFAMMVDRKLYTGKAIISPYITGVGKSGAPHFEIYKSDNPGAFDKYSKMVDCLLGENLASTFRTKQANPYHKW